MLPSREEWDRALVERHGAWRQARFQAARVAVCGLGGLGSNIAIWLARAGVGALHLIDFDRVDLSNLNRQQYFARQLGAYKTEALAQTLREIAPYVALYPETRKVTAEQIPMLFQKDDLVCEAFDRAEAKAMLVNGVLEHYPEKVIVSGSGMAGLDSANRIRTRRLRRLYLCGDGESDSAAGLGLVSARVAVCAAHQATMILRLLCGETEP